MIAMCKHPDCGQVDVSLWGENCPILRAAEKEFTAALEETFRDLPPQIEIVDEKIIVALPFGEKNADGLLDDYPILFQVSLDDLVLEVVASFGERAAEALATKLHTLADEIMKDLP